MTVGKEYTTLALLMQQGSAQIPILKEVVSKVTRKGQVTIPVEIRRYLGVNINDKVAFVVGTQGEVKVSNVRYPDVSSLRGAAGALKKSKTWNEVRRIAREDRIDAGYHR